ncbi:MAG: multidrug ABC transporter ATP-binding protein, partial [Promethearchaeota archaeon]
KDNKTIILTTHNMEEADDLSERLAIIDNGKIIAKGTPQELKGKNGTGDIIEFRIQDQHLEIRDNIISYLNEKSEILWAKNLGKARISFSALDGLKRISFFYEMLENQFQLKMQDLVIRQNTLEDVFLELTGRDLRD